ncbi:MAG: hypothetical protein AAGB10_23380, partial [Pseudomonadota bacterium]
MLHHHVYRVFLRYAERALTLEAQGGALVDAAGITIGQVDAVRVSGPRLIITGQARADRVGVQRDGHRHWVRPAAAAQSGAFTLDVPFQPGPVDLVTEWNGEASHHRFDGIDPRWVARARRALVLPFVTSLVRLAPQIWRWRRHGDLGAREAVKERLG